MSRRLPVMTIRRRLRLLISSLPARPRKTAKNWPAPCRWSDRGWDLSVNIADTSGTVGDVAKDLATEAQAFHELTGSLRQIAETSADAASVAREAVGSAARCATA
jgi:hypothetical protein